MALQRENGYDTKTTKLCSVPDECPRCVSKSRLIDLDIQLPQLLGVDLAGGACHKVGGTLRLGEGDRVANVLQLAEGGKGPNDLTNRTAPLLLPQLSSFLHRGIARSSAPARSYTSSGSNRSTSTGLAQYRP